MDCNMIVVSPVHIGSGYKYGPSEYLHISKKNISGFKRVDIIKYYDSLEESAKKELLDSLSMADFSLKDFDDKIPKVFTKYLMSDKCSTIPSKNEINECIKTFNQAYIPGSSIKGAIRTAILYNNINSWQIRDVNRFVGGKFDTKFIDRFLTYEARVRNSPQKNILKFLQISDSTFSRQIDICDIDVILASEEDGFKSNYTKHNSKSYLEVINRGSRLSFNIKNNFNEKFHNVLNIEEKKDLISIDKIKEWIYEFSHDLIQNELKFSEDYGLKKLNKFYKKSKKYNNPEKPLLRIGHGSGFLSTTLGLKIKEYNYNAFRRIIRNKKAHEFCFPKSRKITIKDNYPLGWVQLDFKEE